MVASISSDLGIRGYSWSPAGKDRDGDGKVSREEFKLPVEPGASSLVPADLKAGGSLDQTFDSYDRDRDGSIDGTEINAGGTAVGNRSSTDRFSHDWDNGMTTAEALTYFRKVDGDNAALIASWGIKL